MSALTAADIILRPVISEKSMSIRLPSEPTRICGASEGHEIPGGLIGGK